MAEIPFPEVPKLPFPDIISGLGVVFPPTWIVIHNGNISDKAVAEAIADYLMTKIPPLIAMVREVLPEAEPDPMDLMGHGVIIVGGPMAWLPITEETLSKWHLKYLEAMDPGYENRGTDEAPDWWLVQTEPAYEIQVTPENHAALISSTMGAFPWLSVWNVAGMHAEDTVEAGELFCAGETKGIFINKTKVP